MGINWLGNLAAAPSNPVDNDAYYDVIKKKSFVWSNSVWSQMTEDGWDGAFVTSCFTASSIFPANPPMDGGYDGVTETPPTDWFLTVPALSPLEALYESKATWRYNGSSWEQTPWSTPFKRTGLDGAPAIAPAPLKPDYTSIIYTNNSIALLPTGGSYDGDIATPPVGWTSEPTTPSSSEYTWLSTRKYKYNIVTGLWEAGAWSVASRLSGEKGELPQQGVDYTLPDGSYISYVFKVAPVNAGVSSIPNGDGSYDGVNEFLPTGWSDDATSILPTEELWMSYCRYVENSGSWSTSTWKTPARFSGAHGATPIKGLDYHDGKDGSFISYIFRNYSGTPPEALGGIYDGVSEGYPALWTDNPTAPSVGNYTYYSKARYINTGTVEVPIWGRQVIAASADNWSLPIQFSASAMEGLVISADSNIFAFDSADANPAPVSTTITAVLTGVSTVVNWTTEPVIAIASPSVGTSFTITAAEFGALTSLKVIATSGVYTDSTTIARVSDGKDGTSGTATEIREVRFQYSPDGIAWHTKPLLVTDNWLREGTFYDNLLQGGWSIGTKIVGDDGADTYTEFWFGDPTAIGTPDSNASDWSTVQAASNVYLISRTTTLGVVGSWGAITSIRGNDGVHGKYFETRFKKGSLALGAPSAPADYLTADLIPTGWGINPDIPLTGDEVIWAITCTKNYDGSLDVNWSGTSAQWGAYNPVRGLDYSDGTSVYYSKVYKEAPDGYTTPPIANTGSWDGTTEVMPDGGWVDDPMTPAVGKFIYESSYTYKSTLVGGVNTWQAVAGTWKTPSKYAYIPTLGTDYTHGDGSFTSYVFKNAAIGVDLSLSPPTGGTYDGTNEEFPSGWIDDLVSPLGDELTWVSHKVYKAVNTVWDNTALWSAPVKFSSTNILVGVLDNELDAVVSDFNGANPIFDGSEKWNFLVYFGGLEVTTDCVFTVVGGATAGVYHVLTVNGLTMSINGSTGAYTLSGNSWSTDKESFTLLATHPVSGGVTSKIFTLTKSKIGDVGEVGTGNRLDIAYADDSIGTGFSLSPTGKNYLGTNVVTWVPPALEPIVSITPSDYEWTLTQGNSGYSNRVDFAYSDAANGVGNPRYATGKLSATYTPATPLSSSEYLGTNVVTWLANNTEPDVSTTASDYEWTNIKGNAGTPIEKYSWVVFSDSKTTGTISLTQKTTSPFYKYTGVKHNNTVQVNPNTAVHTGYDWYLAVDVIDLSDSTMFLNTLDVGDINVGSIFGTDITATGSIAVTNATTGINATMSSKTDSPFTVRDSAGTIMRVLNEGGVGSLEIRGNFLGTLGEGTIDDLTPFTQKAINLLIPPIAGSTGGTFKLPLLPVSIPANNTAYAAPVVISSANDQSVAVSYTFRSIFFDTGSTAPLTSYTLKIDRKKNTGSYVNIVNITKTGTVWEGEAGEPIEETVVIAGTFTDSTHGALSAGTDSITYRIIVIENSGTAQRQKIEDFTVSQVVQGGGVAGAAATLDGQNGTYYLDYDNFNNVPLTFAPSLTGNLLTAVPNGAVFTDTVYTHPTYAGDDFSIDTLPMTGAKVISDLDINITTDTQGHVTDANASVVTRNLTASDIGAAASSHTHNDTTITGIESATASTVVQRNSSADIDARLFKSNYQNQTTISGAIAYRVNTTSSNYIRFCSDMTAVRSFVGVYSKTESDANFLGKTATAAQASKVTVNNSASNVNYPVVFHNNANTLYDDTGSFYYNPSTGLLSSIDNVATSDRDLKTNIKRIENASEKRRAINGYTFDWVDTDMGNSAGELAQEVQAVFPIAVHRAEDDALEKGYKLTLKSQPMFGLLFESANEDYKYFTALIEKQQSEINELKALVEMLLAQGIK